MGAAEWNTKKGIFVV